MNQEQGDVVGDTSQVTISKRVLFFAGCVIVVVSFILGTRANEFGNALAPLVGIKTTSQTLDLSSLQQTYQRLKANFDGKLTDQELLDGANHGLVAAAGDKYTIYLTPKEAGDLDKDLSGDVGGGIGAEIGERNGQPVITKILPDNPAEAAGLKADDVIVSVNDQSADGWSSEKAADTIRGKEGTTLSLTIRRAGKTKHFTITRAIINNPSVQTEVKQGIGIMTITRFDEQTGALARKAAESFKSQHVKGVVVDLRSDGGGYIDAAVDVASIWLDRELVVSQRTHGKTTDKHYGEGDPVFDNMKTVVLVNGGTASASEILSSALRDHGKATLIGEKTFGKGSVQQIIKLSGGAELKVTVAHWYTPKGINVMGKGITPDKTVKLTQKDNDAARDPQLQAALQTLGAK